MRIANSGILGLRDSGIGDLGIGEWNTGILECRNDGMVECSYGRTGYWNACPTVRRGGMMGLRIVNCGLGIGESLLIISYTLLVISFT